MSIAAALVFAIAIAGAIAWGAQVWLATYGERNPRGFLVRTRRNERADNITCVVSLVALVLVCLFLAYCVYVIVWFRIG
jgi:hypothetical protein